jgi:hypothetical protein
MSHGTALSLTPNKMRDYCRPYTYAMQPGRTCSLQPHWSHFGKLNEINILLNRECLLKSIAETETITKAQFGVRTTIISQLFGVNESAVPCDNAKLFRVLTNLIFAVFDV